MRQSRQGLLSAALLLAACGGGAGANDAGPIALAHGPGPFAIAVDATHVYWTNLLGNPGSVMKVPLGGGTPVLLATSA